LKLIALSILVVGFTAIAAAVFMNRYEYVVFHPITQRMEVIQRYDRITGKGCTINAHHDLMAVIDVAGSRRCS
jgi:hypothetical protein